MLSHMIYTILCLKYELICPRGSGSHHVDTSESEETIDEMDREERLTQTHTGYKRKIP